MNIQNPPDYRTAESEVRSYCRAFPATFDTAHGSSMIDVENNEYTDFLSGCGSLNYGHNHVRLRDALLGYIRRGGVSMSMDLQTCSKKRFMEAFIDHVLSPRGLEYRMQFPGPTGTNAIEAAIKLARKATNRTNIIAFTNGFHGCSLGALALTGNRHHRGQSKPLLNQVTHLPFEGYLGDGFNTADMLEKMLGDPSSGCDAPAAIVLETIQGEGGLTTASPAWIQQVARVARHHGALLIVDDIQAGCGRSGNFFSFEALGVEPDIICLAKAVSGYGLPMSLVLMRPDLDQWLPGEHNGTFRGNNLAFVTATEAIETFWANTSFEMEISAKSMRLKDGLQRIANRFGLSVKGRGMMLGLRFPSSQSAAQVQKRCFKSRLIVETCGPHDEVVKLLPPLTVENTVCDKAILTIEDACRSVFEARKPDCQDT